MSSKTTNYNLHKIDLNDSPPDITVLNQNFDIIDENLKTLNDREYTAVGIGAVPLYTSFSQLNLAGGNETINGIFDAMANYSKAQLSVTSGNNGAIYPVAGGILSVEKYNSARAFFEFATKGRYFFGTHIDGTWSGWIEVADASKFIVLTGAVPATLED